MIAHFETNRDVAVAPEHVIKADVVVRARYVVSGSFHINELPYDEKSGTSLLRLPFRIACSGARRTTDRDKNLEDPESNGSGFARCWSNRWSDKSRSLVFPSLLIGDLGNRLGGEIRNFNQQIGFVDYGQIVLLLAGTYRLTLVVATQSAPLQGRADVVDGGSQARKQYSCDHLNFSQRSSERNSPDGI